MRRYILLLLLIVGSLVSHEKANAQQYAFVDMDYIMGNMPAYEAAQEQLEQQSTQWEEEIQEIYKEVEQLYKNYQKENVFLSEEMKTQREEEIIELEGKAKSLQRQYFGPEGEMSKRQEELIQPIQEKVSEAIETIAEEENFDAVFNKAGSSGVVYVNQREDISDSVLEHLGVQE
ncbi:MAG: OmpH family outer membrane protein [Marinilabiliaceae bacterium]